MKKPENRAIFMSAFQRDLGDECTRECDKQAEVEPQEETKEESADGV